MEEYLSENALHVLIGIGGFILGAITGVVALCWYNWSTYYWED